MFSEYPDVLSVVQAAEALHVCKKSVYRLVNEKRLGSVKVGRKILIPKYSLVMYLKSAQYTINNP